MATTIRVYIDGGTTPVATGTMNADRTFSVPVAGVADGVHTVEVTAQEDGKGESPRVIQSVTIAHGVGGAALAGDILVAATAAADLTAPGAPTGHPLAAGISVVITASADLTAPINLWGGVDLVVTAGADLTAPGGGSVGVSYVGAGALTSNAASGGAETVALPAGYAANDILLFATFNTIATPAGWTQKATDGAGYTVYWKRAAGTEGASLSVMSDDGGGEGAAFCGRIFAFRGCVASGDPFDAADASVGTIVSGTVHTGSALTVTAGAMVGLLDFAAPNGTPGGAADTVVSATGSGSMGWPQLAYDSTPPASGGVQTAPTLTWGATTSGRLFTFALKD